MSATSLYYCKQVSSTKPTDLKIHPKDYAFLTIVLLVVNASVAQVPLSKTELPAVGRPKITKNPFADEMAMKHWNIHCGLMDRAGNLWFGATGQGVYKYDGKLFTNYTTKQGLINNVVYSILEDKAGTIWFGTEGGVSRYDGKSFTNLVINAGGGSAGNPLAAFNNQVTSKNTVWSMMQDKSGLFWFGTTDGVYCYNGRFLSYFLSTNKLENKNGLKLRNVQCMIQDNSGTIWFGSGFAEQEGVCRYDGKTLTNDKPNGDGWVRSMVQSKDGKVWLSTRHRGISLYDGKSFTDWTVSTPALRNSSITMLTIDRTGVMWFTPEETDGYGETGDDGGLWHYDGKTMTRFGRKEGLQNTSAWCIVEDRAGSLWVGTRNNGLYKFDGKRFERLSE